jgi:hypothetical protein
MRTQEHIKISAIAATLALPWLKGDIWIPFTSSVLIDVDHYAWYVISQRDLSLRGMARYFQQGKPPQRPEVRLLHQTPVVGCLLLLAMLTRSRVLGLIVAGLLFHISLDRFHKAEMRHLQRSLNEQAHTTCPNCGQQDQVLQLHSVRKPRNLLDRYNQNNFVALCPSCHQKAHKRAKNAGQTV